MTYWLMKVNLWLSAAAKLNLIQLEKIIMMASRTVVESKNDLSKNIFEQTVGSNSEDLASGSGPRTKYL